METKSIVGTKAIAFAIKIVELYKVLCARNEYVLSRQLVRSGTSIGANIHEAVQGFSKKDFTHKMSISLKEANETSYWLLLLRETGYLSDAGNQFDSIFEECIELIKMLTSIVKTSKTNQ